MERGSLRPILFALLASGLCRISAEDRVVIHVIDGKNGKPVATEHILIFEGDSVAAVKQHQQHVDLWTDSRGAALLLGPMPWLQIWVDWHRSCQPDTDNGIYSADAIRSSGVVASNVCGSVSRTAAPNQLYLFVRKETLVEKMRH